MSEKSRGSGNGTTTGRPSNSHNNNRAISPSIEHSSPIKEHIRHTPGTFTGFGIRQGSGIAVTTTPGFN